MILYMRLISTEGALRRPMIYDNHPIASNPNPHIALKTASHDRTRDKLG